MLTKKETKLLTKLRYKAYLLVNRKQIPSYLYRLIVHIKGDTDIAYIKKLIDLSNEFMRVKGYYSSREKEETAEKLIRELLKN